MCNINTLPKGPGSFPPPAKIFHVHVMWFRVRKSNWLNISPKKLCTRNLFKLKKSKFHFCLRD